MPAQRLTSRLGNRSDVSQRRYDQLGAKVHVHVQKQISDDGSGPGKPIVARSRQPTTAAAINASTARVRASQSGDNFVRTH